MNYIFMLLFIFVCGFSAEVAWRISCLYEKKNQQLLRLVKMKLSSTFLIKLRFRGYRCKLGIFISA